MANYAGLGALRERVTLQQATTATDTQGGRTQTWSTLATVWANVSAWPTQPDETIRAGAVNSTLHYRVEMQYRADVAPAMRVSWTPYQSTTARTLEIMGVAPKDGFRVRLLLDCVESA